MKIGHKSEIDIILADFQGFSRKPVDHDRPCMGLQGSFGASGGSAGINQKNCPDFCCGIVIHDIVCAIIG
jgi:hypothetical protein